MEQNRKRAELPPIPAKRYFTIGEVSELCGVKPHVLRYWEQEFTQLKPVKRRGNRRYYQHHEVLLIRRIRELLYEEGFTISGARNRLDHSFVNGDDVKLSGFGNFNIRRKAPRPGRNPRTGEAIPITARNVVTFHASHKLKSLVQGDNAAEEDFE